MPRSWPGQGWRRLIDADDQVLFAAQRPNGDRGDLAFVEFRLTNATWTVSSYGECWPERVFEGDTGGGTWTVAEQVLDGDTALDVLVSERACASGRPPGDRVLPPESWILLTQSLSPSRVAGLDGGQECQTAPPSPYRVELSAPVGNRELRDGLFVPPRPVSRRP